MLIFYKVVVNTMHERKTEMAKRSDSFVALPGGFGTFEEARYYFTLRRPKTPDAPTNNSCSR